MNVYTEELLAGWGVAVADGRVAAIGPEVESLAGPSTARLDLGGDIGDRPDDLALARKRVRQLRGGAAVVARGEVLGEWRAELLGGQSLGPGTDTVEQVSSVQGRAARARL